MTRPLISILLLAALQLTATSISAKEVCKVSMMGRVCYEEGSEVATAEHMKSGAKTKQIASSGSGNKVVAK